MIRISCYIIFLFAISFFRAQTTEISGLVRAADDVENIHVINKTANKFATTNINGVFTIEAKALDTLVFSSIQYKLKVLLVTKEMVDDKAMVVELEENVNKLDEVVVGRVLTRNLESDIENSLAKPKINFYDVGIPGYKGKPLTKREREYKDASNGKIFSYYGIGFSINFYKLLNTVSGRTKRLKNHVRLEKRDELMYAIKAKFSENILGESDFEEHEKMDFWFFCSEDKEFETIAASNNNLLIFEFLQEKLGQYRSNMSPEKD